MRRNSLHALATLSGLGLLLTVSSLPTYADEQSDDYVSRALSNGEYMLVEQPTTGASGVNNQPGAAGGASMADFSMLMSLIQNTVDPDLWESGDATMQAYPGGIFLDTDGVVRRVKVSRSLTESVAKQTLQQRVADNAQHSPESGLGWNNTAGQRVISIKRLLNAVETYAQRGQQWDRELSTLAGLHRIDFVVVDKENDDLLLIGPAGGEVVLQNGNWVNTATGTSPVLLQDVLAVCNAFANRKTPTMICSLDPTAEGVARVHALLSKPDAAARLVRNSAQGAEELVRTMGMHQVSIGGLDPSSPTALALLEADIHMKRLGLGIEKADGQLTSYPDWSEKLGLQPNGQLLRWWFTPDYPEIQCNEEQTVFALPTRRVRLDSERQMMDANGNRNAAGQVDEAADQFADQFTNNFTTIQQQYPIYGRLSHIFDLAVACKLAVEHSKWQSQVELDAQPTALVPKEVEPTTANGTWRKNGQSHKWIVVSGGVELDLKRLDLNQRLKSENGYLAASQIGQSQPEHEAVQYWWWNEASATKK